MKAEINLKKIDLNQYGEAFKLTVIVEGRQYTFDIHEGGFDALKQEFKTPPVHSGQFGRDITYE